MVTWTTMICIFVIQQVQHRGIIFWGIVELIRAILLELVLLQDGLPAGSNFQNVDDATPNADTDYNQATGVATDTFVVQDVPVTGAILYGVQHCMITKKSDAKAATIAP